MKHFKLITTFMWEYMKDFLERRGKMKDETTLPGRTKDLVVCRNHAPDLWGVHEREMDNRGYAKYGKRKIFIHDVPIFVGTLSDCDAYIRLRHYNKIQVSHVTHIY